MLVASMLSGRDYVRFNGEWYEGYGKTRVELPFDAVMVQTGFAISIFSSIVPVYALAMEVKQLPDGEVQYPCPVCAKQGTVEVGGVPHDCQACGGEGVLDEEAYRTLFERFQYESTRDND